MKEYSEEVHVGIGKWEGLYLATSISTFTLKTKGRTKEKYLLNYWGSWHTCFLCCVGIKDLSANNLFQRSLCHFPLLPQVIQMLFEVEFQMINTVHL